MEKLLHPTYWDLFWSHHWVASLVYWRVSLLFPSFPQLERYSGNAHARGNAYGTAASVGVFLVPLMFIRLFAPQQYLQGVILMAVCSSRSFIKSLSPDHPPVHCRSHCRILLD